MRKFKTIMSFNGPDARGQMKRLKRVFHIATKFAASLQRPIAKDLEGEGALARQRARQEVEDALRDMVMALSGKEIEFVDHNGV